MGNVVIDFETTGLDFNIDEILSVSIIDEDENVLLNEYCKPKRVSFWEDAEKIHGITPDMVTNKCSFEDYVSTVRDILESSDYIVSYNSSFESGFLRSYGICIPYGKFIDPMLIFAEKYGEWDDYHGNYRWQKLSKCAEYYGYEFKAHDSLEDVKATLFCLKKMQEDGSFDEYYNRLV